MPWTPCQRTTPDFWKSLVFSACPSQLEPGSRAPLSSTKCQVHLRSGDNCLPVAVPRQYMFAVIILCLKEKHRRLVDFGRGPAHGAEADLGPQQRAGGPAGRPGEDVTGWSKP